MIRFLAVLGFGLVVAMMWNAKPDDFGNHSAATDPHAGLRHACRQFIERAQLETANANWGQYWDWTVINNSDGTFSVGARYAVGATSRYTTCIVRRDGGDIKLLSLTRMR